MYSGLYSGIPDICHYSLSVCVAPLSTEFSRQEYWRGLPFPFPGELSDPGIKPACLSSPASAGGFTTWEALFLGLGYI